MGAASLFISYAEGFRVPSEGQLFQQGSNASTVELKPIRARNVEIGLRGRAGPLEYSLAVFHLKKIDDVLSFKDPDSGVTTATSNGETSHKGVELGLTARRADNLELSGAFSCIRHRYDEWVANGIDFSGNEIESAPRFLGNVTLDCRQALLNRGGVVLEWVGVGSYRIDRANTPGQKYDGHDLCNLRANWFLSREWEVYGRVMNLADRRYAEVASYTSSGREYAPGLPRTAYVGLVYHWDSRPER